MSHFFLAFGGCDFANVAMFPAPFQETAKIAQGGQDLPQKSPNSI